VLAGTTPEWFWKNARSGDFFGGFGNRFLYLTGPKKPPLPNPRQPDPAKLTHIQERLVAIRDFYSQAQFSSGAAKL
jgi:hypothetical protein